MLHHVAGIIGLAERHAHVAQDRIGGDDVKIKLRQRPVADIVGGAKVEDHAVRQREFDRSEEHTSELQSLMRISYAVFCLKKKKKAHKTEMTEKKHTNHQ